jgi:PAS domain S-box-containing protein/putative nucleotidyltransferase with HDIG domain
MQDIPLYNSRIIKSFDEYMRQYYPNVDMASVLDYAGITTFQMEDEGHWLTQTQVDRFYEILVKKSGNENLARIVGQYMPLAKSSGAVSQYTLGFVTPAAAYVMMEKLYPRVSRSVNIETRKVGAQHIEVIVTRNTGAQEKLYQCQNRLGVFEGIAKLFTNKLARVDHPICMHTSGDRCVYHIHWEKTFLSIWKRIVSYGSILAVVGSIILFFSVPAPYSAVAILSLFSIVIGTYCYQIFLEKNELKTSFENHGDMAGDLLKEIDTRYNNAMLVQEIGQASSHILNIDKLLQLTLEVIEKRLDFDRGLIMLTDQNRTNLTYQVSFGYSKEEEISLKHKSFLLDIPDSHEPFIMSFLRQTPFLVKDHQEIEKIIASGSSTYVKQMGAKSFLCVPIVYEGKAEGILAVDNHRSNTQIKQSDVSLLSGIAHQIGISIHNAKTYRFVLENEEQYTRLVATMPDVVVRTDLDGKILFVNDHAFRTSGYIREEMEGQNMLMFVSPEDQNRLIQNTFLMLENKLGPQEYHLIMKDGRKIPFEVNGDVLRNKDGTPFALVFVCRDMTERKQAEEKIQSTLESLRKAIGTTIQVMVSAIELRDPYTSGHQIRSADIACVIAEEMGLDQEKIDGIRMAGIIHDIGKLSVPSEILSKPTTLTHLEFSLIKEHSRSGYEMLKNVESPWPLAEIIYQHHERMNGTGYPRNLKGNEIIMEARILAVADVVEAMASHRPYRGSLGIEAALEEIENNKGILYDKAVADACLRLFREKGYQLK